MRFVVSQTLSGAKLPARVIIQEADKHGQPIMEPPLADFGFLTEETLRNAHQFVDAVNGRVHLLDLLRRALLRIEGNRSTAPAFPDPRTMDEGLIKEIRVAIGQPSPKPPQQQPTAKPSVAAPSDKGISAQTVHEKLVALAYCVARDLHEDAAGHLCDLLEHCRHNIHPSAGPPFNDLREMVACYGKDPTPINTDPR